MEYKITKVLCFLIFNFLLGCASQPFKFITDEELNADLTSSCEELKSKLSQIANYTKESGMNASNIDLISSVPALPFSASNKKPMVNKQKFLGGQSGNLINNKKINLLNLIIKKKCILEGIEQIKNQERTIKYF